MDHRNERREIKLHWNAEITYRLLCAGCSDVYFVVVSWRILCCYAFIISEKNNLRIQTKQYNKPPYFLTAFVFWLPFGWSSIDGYWITWSCLWSSTTINYGLLWVHLLESSLLKDDNILECKADQIRSRKLHETNMNH